MTKKELITAISKDSHISESAVERVLKSMESTIALELFRGKTVSLHGFGKFTTTVREPHGFYNVNTAQRGMTKRSVAVRFSPSVTLKRFVN